MGTIVCSIRPTRRIFAVIIEPTWFDSCVEAVRKFESKLQQPSEERTTTSDANRQIAKEESFDFATAVPTPNVAVATFIADETTKRQSLEAAPKASDAV